MSELGKKQCISAKIIKAYEDEPIAKALEPTELQLLSPRMFISPAYDMNGLGEMVAHSTILPQCIRAYKDNIAGFGIGVRYIDDVPETAEMSKEFALAEKIVDKLCLDMDTKEVFEDIVEAREIYGIGYLEVIRNLAGEVDQIDFIKETPSIQKTAKGGDSIDTVYFYKGEAITRKKKFCKYKQ